MSKNYSNYLIAFISGLVVPAVFLSLSLFILSFYGKLYLFSWDLLLGPIIYGLWNSFYFFLKDRYPIKKETVRFGIHGAILGFLFVASFFVYPEAHQEMSLFISELSYSIDVNLLFHGLSLIWVPLFYYWIWRYLILPINKFLGSEI